MDTLRKINTGRKDLYCEEPINMNLINIGIRIKKVRTSRDLKQDEFSETLGVNRHSLSRIEAGKQQPPIEMVTRIWDKYGVDSNWILNGVDSNPSDVDSLISELRYTKNLLVAKTRIINLIDQAANSNSITPSLKKE